MPDGAALEIRGLELVLDGPGERPVVTDLDITLHPGEIVGLVGESGSGKTLTGLAVTGLLPAGVRRRSGAIVVRGRTVEGDDTRPARGARREGLAMIFQNPMTSLNPSMRVGKQIAEAVRRHQPGLGRRAAHDEAIALIEQVEIREPRRCARQYPHELSGGMRQRVMIAIALACRPAVLIADEPTTALDVTVQRGVMQLLRRLSADLGLAILLVSHDLAVVAEQCSRVLVMYAGEIVESGPTRAVLADPLHPYVMALRDCVPERAASLADVHALPGRVPRPGEWAAGCRFAPRCAHRMPECDSVRPALAANGEQRSVRCLLHQPVGESTADLSDLGAPIDWAVVPSREHR